MGKLNNMPFIVIDLGTGRYLQYETGHELYNLIKNPVDGRYYGYCPPWDNVDIRNLGAKSSDSSIDNVIVIYTTKIEKSNNRLIIAFTDCATVHRQRIVDKKLNRKVIKNGKLDDCSYSIESDYLYNLETYSPKFIINIAQYNTSMFRKQRFYKGKYPQLDKDIINYLETYLINKDFIEDELYQDEIQKSGIAIKGKLKNTANKEPEMTNTGGCTAVKKNPAFAKQALVDSDYICAGDSKHKTFMTNKGVPYMEGHHLIPCTATNARLFWNEFKKSIDCVENIVCLCPTCHRRIHFGTVNEKKTIIKHLYAKQEKRLKAIGITITEDELLDLYLK